jgi:hypothetical protein
MPSVHSSGIVKKAIRELWRTERVDDATFLPLPFPRNFLGKSCLLFAPCQREGPRVAKERLFAPEFLAYVPLPELKPLQFDSPVLSEIGFQCTGGGQPIGLLSDLNHLPHGEYSSKQARYFQLLDRIFEDKWGETKISDEEKKAIAVEILEILKEITLPALSNYYEWAGQELQAWCRNQADVNGR